jgi:hypothetical protein
MSYFKAIKWEDTTGASNAFKNVDGKPRFSSTGYLYDIAEGNVTGHTVWTKNGYNGALSASMEDLWAVGGEYVFPATQQQMEVVSSSTDDDSAGTGARTVYISYLDNTFTEHEETLTLDGTTPVATTATNIYRVNTFRVATTGTGLQNAGNIDIRSLDVGEVPIYSRIATGINRAINIIYTVPKDKCLFIYNIFISAGGNVANRPVRFITKATYDNISASLIGFFMPYTNAIITDGSCDIPIEAPTKFCAGTDIKVSAISPDGATYGAVTLRGWLETV